MVNQQFIHNSKSHYVEEVMFYQATIVKQLSKTKKTIYDELGIHLPLSRIVCYRWRIARVLQRIQKSTIFSVYVFFYQEHC